MTPDVTSSAASSDGYENNDTPSNSNTNSSNPATINDIGVNISDYLKYFQDGSIPTDEIDHRAIMPLWNSPRNLDLLAVGSPLQPSFPSDKYYKLISALYSAAKLCVSRDDDCREARVLILTASLFEQCRVTGARTVRSFFGDASLLDAVTMSGESVLNHAGIGMRQVLPFCYRGQLNSSSEDAMRSYLLDEMDLEKQKDELMREEPNVQVRYQGEKITLNSLTSFKYLVQLSYDDNCFFDDENETEAETATLFTRKSKFIPNDESLRIILRRDGTLIEASYFPYAMQRSLANLGVKNGDVIEVEEIEGRGSNNSIDPLLIRTVNACFDPSVQHWLPDTYTALYRVVSTIIPSVENDQLSLFRAAMKFWSEPGTGRIRFLSADAQMVSIYSSDPNSNSYVGLCYTAAKKYFQEEGSFEDDDAEAGGYATAVGSVLTAGLMEQGQFTDMGKLLEMYSFPSIVVEAAMRENHPYLYDAYSAVKSRDALREYVQSIDIKSQKHKVRSESLSMSVRFYHVQTRDYHFIDVNPLVTLETLLGIHTNVSKYSYQFVGITTDEGKTILFSESRRKTLVELGIKNRSVLNLEDMKRQPDLPELPSNTSDEKLVKEFMHNVKNLVEHYVRKQVSLLNPKTIENLGENGSIITAIARYFLQPEKMKTISTDQMDKFEGNSPYAEIYKLAQGYMEKGSFFEAKVTVIMALLVEQCQINGVPEVVVYLSSQKFLSNIATLEEKLQKYTSAVRLFALVREPDTLMKYLQKFNIYKHVNTLRGNAPRINLMFSNRSNGKDEACMSNVNSHMTLTHFIKKHAVEKHGKSLQSLRIAYNGCRVFLSSCGKSSLRQLGMKDNDVVIVEDVSSSASTAKKQAKNKNKGNVNSKKKNKGKAKQKNKPRQQIVIPKTEEELRKDHSKMLSPVLDQLERERLRFIRLKLNNLLIKKTSAKERRPSKKEKKVDIIPVFTPLTDGLEGKAGKVVFPVVVGYSENLYKSSKKSKLQRNQVVRMIDLHGCTAGEAITKLNNEMPTLTEAAMKEETFTLPVNIVCGGGHQILSEVVEQWIRRNSQVANRPKGFV